ncbi:hypothetical protein SAMN02745157_4866 [Kaistia soli DSM 19436]|uniref:Uncharacterized protein n=1 Tax=Kaistia soli DSM 19436 TaxID=1122133 RepID=A0A1M5MTE5_9HYPH|nr:hypothetical protein [Kaistia soli]SHG80053.1 hypothetical protein SAMN02745157_4866 [Kaistia soli DSM 19436]
MTEISLDLRRQMNAEQTGVVPITLLTFEHDALPAPLRISSDRTGRVSDSPLVYGTVSRGQTYLWVPLSAILPDENDQAPPELRISITTVDRSIFPVIRSSPEPATVTMELVYDGDLDTVQVSIGNLKTQAAPYDEGQVSIVMGQDDFGLVNFPRGRMNPIVAPGLHR